ncbi:MAG: D-glycerate dehydrogenase [Defluviimonas sp.]|uniref:2-hydroxyacid dehydrogenase n=1 Tax=Albidovulum sp. TaxID=1872424 RepID=UPI001DC519F4|nr:D-glycerate dehydrogenase [Paracoccaceae bacterium]MCC0062558.1 D-glycerate dehydrogenase [Defluviimonas sp.]
MTRPKLVLTRRWPEAIERRLEAEFETILNPDDRPLGPDGLRSALETCDGLLATVTDRLGPEVFAGLTPRARLIANYGVGVSHIDCDAARALGIAVTNTPDVLSDCTADLAMTLLLITARRVREGEAELRAGLWTGWRPTHLVGTKVAGATIGIVGFGRIGQAMAARARFGFGMEILVYNRSAVPAGILARFGARQVGGLGALMGAADFVSLHCPGGAANRHLIGAEMLAAMRPGAFLINTARGEVVDEAALAAALAAGRIAGAGLDVYEHEPRVPAALLAAPNLVLLPHLGSATAATREAMGARVLDNVSAFFAGAPAPDRVV